MQVVQLLLQPSRISCIVQFGEGEIIDVERKNELAGNIHGKGIMIAVFKFSKYFRVAITITIFRFNCV